MRFLYRYYYTFFSLHLKDNHKGTNKTPAWVSALFQVGLGVGGLFFNVVMIANFIINGDNTDGSSPNKFLAGLAGAIIPTAIIYYLLFDFYDVSKKTGLTTKDFFIPTKRDKFFFWSFWPLSLFGMALVGRLIKVSNI